MIRVTGVKPHTDIVAGDHILVNGLDPVLVVSTVVFTDSVMIHGHSHNANDGVIYLLAGEVTTWEFDV